MTSAVATQIHNVTKRALVRRNENPFDHSNAPERLLLQLFTSR
jgi:hypothetical protein